MRSWWHWVWIVVAVAMYGPVAFGQSDLQKKLKDTDVGARWIYNDIGKGFTEARATGKPLLVTFRCVP